MNDDLLTSLDKLHTTSLGAERVRRNLSLPVDDIVLWCKEAVEQHDVIFGLKKNWYVYRNGIVITINRQCYTIITAHPLSARVRALREPDYGCLREFLYQAVFVPEGAELPSRDVIDDPQVFAYIKAFGTQADDLGVVAEENQSGQLVGAAWTRIIPAYGHLDTKAPELAISLLPEFRGYGIGTKLMKRLHGILQDNGYTQTSLSVQKDNPATRLYERLGYRIVAEKLDHAGHEDYLMVKDLWGKRGRGGKR